MHLVVQRTRSTAAGRLHVRGQSQGNHLVQFVCGKENRSSNLGLRDYPEMSKLLTSHQLGVLKRISKIMLQVLKLDRTYVYIIGYHPLSWCSPSILRQEVAQLKRLIDHEAALIKDRQDEWMIVPLRVEIRKIELDLEGLSPLESMHMEQKWKEIEVEVTERLQTRRAHTFAYLRSLLFGSSNRERLEQERFEQLEREQLERLEQLQGLVDQKLELILNQKQQEIDEELFLLQRLPIKERDMSAQEVLENKRSMLAPKKPVNPPTLTNVHLLAFTRGMHTKLKNAIYAMVICRRAISGKAPANKVSAQVSSL